MRHSLYCPPTSYPQHPNPRLDDSAAPRRVAPRGFSAAEMTFRVGQAVGGGREGDLAGGRGDRDHDYALALNGLVLRGMEGLVTGDEPVVHGGDDTCAGDSEDDQVGCRRNQHAPVVDHNRSLWVLYGGGWPSVMLARRPAQLPCPLRLTPILPYL